MPVECSVAVEPLDQEDFHRIDRRVMGEIFAMHNSMGRFFDERNYQCEPAACCGGLGIDARRELEVCVTHGDFAKSYFLDLLIGRGCIYGLKTMASLGPLHDKQLIHYLLLTDLGHGKLVDFRPGSVGTRVVSTRLRHADRKNFPDRCPQMAKLMARHWKPGCSLKTLSK